MKAYFNIFNVVQAFRSLWRRSGEGLCDQTGAWQGGMSFTFGYHDGIF